MDKLRKLDVSSLQLNNIFKEDIINEKFNEALVNLDKGKETMVNTIGFIDNFFDTKFIQECFDAIMENISSNRCSEVSDGYKNVLSYSGVVDIPFLINSFMLYELDILLSYVVNKLEVVDYGGLINKKITAKHGIRITDMIPGWNVYSRTCEVQILFDVQKGPHLAECLKYKSSILSSETRDNININYISDDKDEDGEVDGSGQDNINTTTD